MSKLNESIVPAPAPQTNLSVKTEQRGLRVILWHVLTTATAKSLSPPKPPSDLDQMPPLLRIHACLKLFLLDTEYALSPGGQLRGLAKLACRITLVTGSLALCLAFVLACAAAILGIVVLITGMMVTILWNLILAMLMALALMILGVVWLWIIRMLF